MSTKDYLSLDAVPRKLKTLSAENGNYLTLWSDGNVVSCKPRTGLSFGNSFLLEKNDAMEVFMKNGIPYPEETQSSHQSTYERHSHEYDRLQEAFQEAKPDVILGGVIHATSKLEDGKMVPDKITIQPWSEIDEKRTLG